MATTGTFTQLNYHGEPGRVAPPGSTPTIQPPPPVPPPPTTGTGGNTPPLTTTMTTGGNTPPTTTTAPGTGGNTPPGAVTVGTGGNTPPTTTTPGTSTPAPPTGGNTPPLMQPRLPTQSPTMETQKPLPTSSPVQLMDWQSKLRSGNTDAQTREVTADETVEHRLTGLTAGDSRYIQIARDKAQSAASARGLMMSSMSAGNAERSAIEAALPIAQQDAQTYGRTASENMAAVNTDRLADQNMHGQIVGQELGIRANLDEAERGRGHQTNENIAQRNWQGAENSANREWQTGENNTQRDWQTGERVGQQEWQAGENGLNRAFEESMRRLDQDFRGTQQEKADLQQRFLEFNTTMRHYNENLSQTLASIYSNPNLTAAQQQAAADNARAVHQSLYNSYAATMSAGVPQIFWAPYQMQGQAQQPTPGTTTPPTTTPIGGGSPGGGGFVGGGTLQQYDTGSAAGNMMQAAYEDQQRRLMGGP